MTSLLLNIIILYSKAINNAKSFFKYIYDSDESFQSLVDDICYGFKCIKSYVNGNKIEPYYTSWVSVCNIDEKYDLNEKYHVYKPKSYIQFEFDNLFMNIDLYDDEDDEEYIKKINSKNQWYNNKFSEAFDECMDDINNFEYEDALILIKYPEHNRIVSNIMCYNNTKRNVVFNPPSNVKFLSIKYSHPQMKEPIFFELDREYFIVENEILSNTFILRLLNYQTKYYVFDNNYELEIIDNNINVKILKCNNYILLEEKDYKVKEYVFTDDEVNDDALIDGNVEKTNIENEDNDMYVICDDDTELHQKPSYLKEEEETEDEEEDAAADENEENILSDGDLEGMMLDIKSLANVINSYVINKPNYSTANK